VNVQRTRINRRLIIAVVAAAGIVAGGIGLADHLRPGAGHVVATHKVSDDSALAGNDSVKLTCARFNGAGFVNWDVLVQLNPDGTAASAAPLGDAYTTGVQMGSVTRTDPADITISDNGRKLSFAGSALWEANLGGVGISLGGPVATCVADYTFPNPSSPVFE
jgi:hypothetical protein